MKTSFEKLLNLGYLPNTTTTTFLNLLKGRVLTRKIMEGVTMVPILLHLGEYCVSLLKGLQIYDPK